jgi:hypothetical protein
MITQKKLVDKIFFWSSVLADAQKAIDHWFKFMAGDDNLN